MEKKFGVTAAAPVAIAAGLAAGRRCLLPLPRQRNEQTEFAVTLKEYPADKNCRHGTHARRGRHLGGPARAAHRREIVRRAGCGGLPRSAEEKDPAGRRRSGAGCRLHRRDGARALEACRPIARGSPLVREDAIARKVCQATREWRAHWVYGPSRSASTTGSCATHFSKWVTASGSGDLFPARKQDISARIAAPCACLIRPPETFRRAAPLDYRDVFM